MTDHGGGTAHLALRGLTKRFGDVLAADRVDLALEEGELLTLLGPSGCGKTTVLRLVAGFETPDDGRVVFRGEDVTTRPPQGRGFGMVFQSYALFPHLDVFENVAFGLRSAGVPRAHLAARVEAALELVDLAGFAPRRVQELSGGQQQRVALARALAPEPPLLLLDEPLSNLDAALRERTRKELRRLLKGLGITALFVTHDQEEAFDLSDKIAVMAAGRIRQVGTPEALYRRPADGFVAGFVGKANALPARVDEGPPGEGGTGRGGRWLRLEEGALWPAPGSPEREAVRGSRERETPRASPERDAPRGRASGMDELPPGAAVRLMVRPEDLELLLAGEAGAGESGSRHAGTDVAAGTEDALRGVVLDRRFRGPVTLYTVETTAGRLVEVIGPPDAAEPGARVALRLRPGARVHAFPEGEERDPRDAPAGGGEGER